MSEQLQVDSEKHHEPLLEVKGLTKHFVQGTGFIDKLFGATQVVQAVDDVDLWLNSGETLGIVGESGCGKTTLAKTVVRLLKPTSGSIKIKGEEISDLSEKEIRPYRKQIQMIFQNPQGSLNPRKPIGDILKTPMEVHGMYENDRAREERVEELVETVGLKQSHLNRYPNEFSGGQLQRIGIARALSVDPEIVVADEPVSELDVSVQAQIINLLQELQNEFGLSIIFIGHDLSVIRHIVDRVGVMYLGKLVELGPTERIFNNPEHPYTKSLISAVPRINPGTKIDRIILEGTVPSPIDPPSGCRFHTRCPAVIPPSDWTGTHDEFKACFTYRDKLMMGNVNIDEIEHHLERKGKRPNTEDIADHIIQNRLNIELEELAPEYKERLVTATIALVEGDRERCRKLLDEKFASPCELKEPRAIDTPDEGQVRCHLSDPAISDSEWNNSQ